MKTLTGFEFIEDRAPGVGKTLLRAMGGFIIGALLMTIPASVVWNMVYDVEPDFARVLFLKLISVPGLLFAAVNVLTRGRFIFSLLRKLGEDAPR
jgi:hypothetical protein